MNSNSDLFTSKLGLQTLIWGAQLIMLASFLVFSFLPLLSFLLFFLPYFDLVLFILITVSFLLLTSVSFFGIITLRSNLRLITGVFFSFGTFFNFFDPYLFSLSFIISWLFYELWFPLMIFRQIDEEYSTYAPGSIERSKLMKSFQDQLTSFVFFAWIVLIITWGILFFASNFYIELGEEKGFGTLGLALSVIILLSIYLSRKMVKKLGHMNSTRQQSEARS